MSSLLYLFITQFFVAFFQPLLLFAAANWLKSGCKFILHERQRTYTYGMYVGRYLRGAYFDRSAFSL